MTNRVYGEQFTRARRARARQQVRSAVKSVVEPLENRQLLSASYATVGSTYAQNFDASTAGALPAGWLGNKTATGTSNAPYVGALGAAVTPGQYANSNSGGFFYYGDPEKALGSTGSNSFGGAVYGVNLVNNSGQPITQVTVALDYEMWRRGSNAIPDVTTFGYRLGGSDDLSGPYTNVAGLNSSFTTGATGSPGATQSKNVTFTLSSPWNSGDILSIRFDDPNNPNTDDAIAVDNFTLTAPVVNTATTTTITSVAPTPTTSGTTVTFQATVSPNSGSSVPTGTVSFISNSGTGTVLATGTVDGAGNVSATGTPAAGTYTDIVAVYSPTGSFGGSTSSAFGSPLVVNYAAIAFDGTTYTQDFSNLPAASPNAGFDIPVEIGGVTGWSYMKSGGSGAGNSLGYFVNSGASSTGGVYNYGATPEDTDRALGVLASSSNAGRVGAKFANTSGSTIDNVTISLDAETWRAGDATANTIVFEYLVGGADINDANVWVPVTALDLTRTGAPGSGGGSGSDGNTNKTGLSASLTGLGWTSGQTFTIRWTDSDNSGADDGLAVDNFSLALTPTNAAGTFNIGAPTVRVAENGIASILITRTGGTSGPADISYTLADISTSPADYTAPSGAVHFDDGQESATITVQTTDDSFDELAERFTITLTGVSNTTGTGAAIGANTLATVTISDVDGHVLSGGAFSQNWANTDLITVSDNWDDVANITGYATDADRDAGLPDVLANQSNPNISNGGVLEFDGITDPTIALQASNSATAPQLVIDLNTTGVGSANVSFNVRDLDATGDNAAQNLRLGYRIGNTGEFVDFLTLEDVTTGPDLAEQVTPVSVALPAEAVGQQLVQLRILTDDVPSGANETIGIDDISITAGVVSQPASVVGRQILYNNSAFDGNDLAAGVADDGAIATDKSALLPGGVATFANYTSYTRGINGVMIDVADLAGTPTAADFTFKIGNNNSVGTWATAPAPASITVRTGAGVGGSDRVTITWADNAIQKQWLQVTVLANANTGLTSADTFYFGNAVADTGNSAANATVNSTDEIGARNNPRTAFTPAPVTFAYDFNRDKLVNSTDQILARNNGTTAFNDLELISPPASAEPLFAAAAVPSATFVSSSASSPVKKADEASTSLVSIVDDLH